MISLSEKKAAGLTLAVLGARKNSEPVFVPVHVWVLLVVTLPEQQCNQRHLCQLNPCYKNELFRDDVFRLRTFLPLSHFHRDFLPFFKGFKSFHLDSGVMHKHILTALVLDETKALVIIEPLDGSYNSFA